MKIRVPKRDRGILKRYGVVSSDLLQPNLQRGSPLVVAYSLSWSVHLSYEEIGKYSVNTLHKIGQGVSQGVP